MLRTVSLEGKEAEVTARLGPKIEGEWFKPKWHLHRCCNDRIYRRAEGFSLLRTDFGTSCHALSQKIETFTPRGGVTVRKTDPTGNKDDKKFVLLDRQAVYLINYQCVWFFTGPRTCSTSDQLGKILLSTTNHPPFFATSRSRQVQQWNSKHQQVSGEASTLLSEENIQGEIKIVHTYGEPAKSDFSSTWSAIVLSGTHRMMSLLNAGGWKSGNKSQFAQETKVCFLFYFFTCTVWSVPEVCAFTLPLCATPTLMK